MTKYNNQMRILYTLVSLPPRPCSVGPDRGACVVNFAALTVAFFKH